MIPLTATAAMAAPDDDAKASVVIRGTDEGFHGAMSSHARQTHMLPAPATYQCGRVKEESTIGAQANSSVNARFEAAMIIAACCTATPALTRLLPNASPIPPPGHAVQTCSKKNAPGRHFSSSCSGFTIALPRWTLLRWRSLDYLSATHFEALTCHQTAQPLPIFYRPKFGRRQATVSMNISALP